MTYDPDESEVPAPDAPALPVAAYAAWRRKSEPSFVCIKRGDAFVWGFWAGLGASFAMALLSIFLVIILSICGVALR